MNKHDITKLADITSTNWDEFVNSLDKETAEVVNRDLERLNGVKKEILAKVIMAMLLNE